MHFSRNAIAIRLSPSPRVISAPAPGHVGFRKVPGEIAASLGVDQRLQERDSLIVSGGRRPVVPQQAQGSCLQYVSNGQGVCKLAAAFRVDQTLINADAALIQISAGLLVPERQQQTSLTPVGVGQIIREFRVALGDDQALKDHNALSE